MATNLVTQITQYLASEIGSRMAASYGIDKATAQKAITAAVPALLSALISLVSKPHGATKLSDAVAQQEPGVLSSLGKLIGNPGEKALIDNGASALSALIGGKSLSGLSSAVAQYAGISEKSTNSLLGLLGPVVLGTLANEQRSKGFDASGLAGLLNSQKDFVSSALPAGFSKYLSASDIPDRAPPTPVRTNETTAPSIWPWVFGALALLALGALIFNYSSREKETVETANPKQETEPAAAFNALKGVKVGDVDVGNLASSAVNELYASLNGIKDEASAKAQLPQLTDASSKFDQLGALLNQLSPETRTALVAAFAGIRPKLDKMLDNVLAIPGVGALLKPTVDEIRSRLNALSSS